MEKITSRLKGLGERTGLAGKLPIKKPDGLAAITVGIANVPDGMASGVLAGVNPVFGIYTLMVGTPIAALSCSTQLMMFNTTSAMTLVATDALGTRTGDERVQALIAVALIAGIFQLAMGVLGPRHDHQVRVECRHGRISHGNCRPHHHGAVVGSHGLRR